MKIQNIIKFVTIGVFICVAGLFFCMNQIQQEDSAKEEWISCDTTQEPASGDKEASEKADDQGQTKGSIFVHVCGAVKKSGVYELKEGSRVCDAITAAGGFKKTANQTYLNQAQPLSDGEQVVIPVKGKTNQNTTETSNETSSSQNTQKVSINRATCEELMTLPGIGEAKASSIIKYREENGGFHTLEDLKKIQGIKDGVYGKIADYIML